MFTLNCKGTLISLEQPVVMGIINATPDSFYGGSRAATLSAALEKASTMIQEGAFILDIGGQSTRPGSVQIGGNEEMDRVVPVIEAVKKAFPKTLVSVDTYIPSVAIAAVNAGADIVNDISGGRFFEDMLSTVASLNVPYICMHSRGTIETMHEKPTSNNIITELLDYFIERVDACTRAGIKDIIIDPGFGFGKTIQDNFALLKEMEALQILQNPLLLGVSRKSSIYQILKITPEESLNGTTVLNTVGLMNKAMILRVHDVKEAAQAIQLYQMMK
ncbi:MAG TPA: dihydropteroate synthase [Sediminibacterium sp.]|uniref:dihydropteroate synthase n=1 Tax=Sediminibacterium sp. TaxID=1917865 RepID=UPI0008C7FE97|nr:dihydropteroate synthase [Sediminibacterium sp.]OHC84255.1 MAG: dihydropteroate synthase [Sphingobacteriia bacterium RIFOXYC2_FULL_35_18]OHC88794.1 MAG: dihydropteroate synthase [Sphingobacteriia bacterium RIFOXYD2_FULL_35_12]HLD53863.1 dihydropteroate synthase [Sediminibacterium sp.]